ncbi:hypothetical protein DLAC_08243 [Tieghemostelium lacteum]|uniref:Uncharacterized protein n=1 Tax=Tieghemostelium lacteum TaxID=361077 RepID=A0A151ZBH5_TIELA|nr:hypothetical protein DLAC_08243 [Tieghemostelium lacteum]|eukprot:KYQ91302.1 hypothetical protein DLAC_08243 [Tieghemostelium lacteum]
MNTNNNNQQTTTTTTTSSTNIRTQQIPNAFTLTEGTTTQQIIDHLKIPDGVDKSNISKFNINGSSLLNPEVTLDILIRTLGISLPTALSLLALRTTTPSATTPSAITPSGRQGHQIEQVLPSYTNCLRTDTDLVSLFKDFLVQSAESSRRQEELLKESSRRQEELLKESSRRQEDLLKDIQKSLSPQRDQVSISKIKTAQWDTVQNSLGIDFITSKEISFPKDLIHIPNFDWEGKSEQTMTTPAVQHLTKYFSFPDHKYINTSGKKDLLYLNHPSIPIIFKGNANVVLVPANTPNEEIFHNILFTIDFKTSSDRVESSRLQANSQLLCSNIKSSYPVINIITDLGSTWRFKWFQENTDPETKNENPKLIVTCAIDSPSKAYELMKMRMRNLTPHFSLTKILKSKADLNFINPIKFRLKSKANDVGNIEDLLDILDEDEAKDMLTHHFLHHLSLLEGQTRPPDQMYI